MPKRARSRKSSPRRNPFAPLARKARAKVVPSKKIYRRKGRHPNKGADGDGGN